MRLWGCGLLALAGCNAIFGLDDNATLSDAGGGPDGPPRIGIPFRFQVSSTAQDMPVDALEYVSLTTAPTLRVGTDTLDVTSYDTDSGTVDVSLMSTVFETPDVAWRLEYTFPGGVPHELQWKPVLEDIRLTVPIAGRLDRVPPPAGSGYDLTPTVGGLPPPNPFRASRLFTTGVFLDVLTGADGTNPAQTRIDTVDDKTFSGPLGSPLSASGDRGLLVNYGAIGACSRLADGYAEFVPPPLVALSLGAPSPQPSWEGKVPAAVPLAFLNKPGPQIASRVIDALGGTAPGSRRGVRNGSFVVIGHIPHPDLPADTVTQTLPVEMSGNVFENIALPTPLIFALAHCDLTSISTTDEFMTPPLLDNFPRVAFGAGVDRRAVGGADLVSSVTSVSLVTGTATIDFDVPLATGAITLSDGTTPLDLAGPDDSGSLAPGVGSLDLVFELEPGLTRVDYFEVTVFEIVSAELVPRRVLISTQVGAPAVAPRTIETPIKIERALFTSGTYVLSIATISGTPDAARGNFERVQYPQARGTIFTRAFTVQ